MSYDVQPLLTLQEKDYFLKRAVQEKLVFFFEHDPENECCTVKETEKGIAVDEIFSLQDLEA
jgi:hypothetical protein